MDGNDEISYVFKIVIVGDAGVGKSNLLLRYTKSEFDSGIKPTVGVEFSSKKILVNNVNIKLQIWDTAGQEKFRSVGKQYYKGAVGVMLVYDISKRKSFESIPSWVEEVRNHAAADVVIIIVGNKKDLEALREVSVEEGQNLAKEQGCYFLETSALDNSDKMVEKVFLTLTEDIYKRKQEENDGDTPAKPNAAEQGKKIELAPASKEPQKEKKKGCC